MSFMSFYKCICFVSFKYRLNIIISDSHGTLQALADLDSTNSANIGLAVVVGILCIVAISSIILNVFLWISR